MRAPRSSPEPWPPAGSCPGMLLGGPRRRHPRTARRRRRAREIWGAPRRCGGVAHCARIGGCWSPNVAARAPRVNQEIDPKCTSCDNLIFDRSTRVDLLSVTSARHWNLFTWQPDFLCTSLLLHPSSIRIQYSTVAMGRGVAATAVQTLGGNTGREHAICCTVHCTVTSCTVQFT